MWSDVSSPDVHPYVVEKYDEKLSVPKKGGDLGVDKRQMIQHREHLEEHESCRVADSRPNSYDEQIVCPRRDIQDDESPVVIQHEQHMVDHESIKEGDVRSMHGEPSREGQLEVHIEPVMVEDEQPPLGSVVDEEQTYVQAAGKVTVLADTCPQEMLEYDRTVWQEIGGLEEHGVSYQAREMAVHPSLRLHIDEVQTDVVAAIRAATFSGSNPLQEYIDGVCSTVCPLFPIRGREAGFLGHVLIVQVEHQELSMDQFQHSRHIPCTGVHALYW